VYSNYIGHDHCASTKPSHCDTAVTMSYLGELAQMEPGPTLYDPEL